MGRRAGQETSSRHYLLTSITNFVKFDTGEFVSGSHTLSKHPLTGSKLVSGLRLYERECDEHRCSWLLTRYVSAI